jgi:hypothetical protein
MITRLCTISDYKTKWPNADKMECYRIFNSYQKKKKKINKGLTGSKSTNA